MKFKELYSADKKRNPAGGYKLRFLFLLRIVQTRRNAMLQRIIAVLLQHYRLKYGLEIPYKATIGKGLYLGHAFNITINPNVVIGDNCNIHKGVVIGQTNRGERKGVPIIGNKVWIGINAAIVGGITIGDDVLIAPNSFINQDVPSHSVVFGNPCIVKHRDNATENYIIRVVE